MSLYCQFISFKYTFDEAIFFFFLRTIYVLLKFLAASLIVTSPVELKEIRRLIDYDGSLSDSLSNLKILCIYDLKFIYVVSYGAGNQRLK